MCEPGKAPTELLQERKEVGYGSGQTEKVFNTGAFTGGQEISGHENSGRGGKAETAAKGITELDALRPVSGGLYLWQGDITTLRCDAIVNAANSGMTGCYVPNHRCIDNCIHFFSGIQLRMDCAEMMRKQGHEEETGKARITKAYNLPCRYILHTVGPIISGHLTEEDCNLLGQCYRSCLELAAENNLESLAFCCISTGEFHFPNDRAAQIAVGIVKEFMQKETSVKRVVFNVFKDLDKEIYRKLLRVC